MEGTCFPQEYLHVSGKGGLRGGGEKKRICGFVGWKGMRNKGQKNPETVCACAHA